MKHYWLRLLICGIFITNAASTVASGKDEINTVSSTPDVQSNQSRLGPRETQQTTERSRDEKNIQDKLSTQSISNKLPESDQDRLRELEQEISEEQLTTSGHGREMLDK
jgi:hypothetical protein